MDVKTFLDITPQTLTIAPTHKCTASCKECCFSCSPRISHIMDYGTIVKHIDETMSTFPDIEVVVLTGGECFLLGDDLERVIRHASSYNVVIRVVTNGFWASSYENALERLSKLVDAGLKEINFSTGDNHQQFVSFDNIENGVRAAYDLGIKTICIAIEASPDAIFNMTDILNNAILEPMVREGVLMFLNSSWMKLKKSKEEEKVVVRDSKRPCLNLFTGIVISPYSQMLACCGLTVEYNKFLKLGNLQVYSVKELYDEQFKDYFKLWLFVDGPEYIYELVMLTRNMDKKNFPHECAYCMELVNDEENIKVIRDILPKELNGIIFRYKMRHTKLNVKN